MAIYATGFSGTIGRHLGDRVTPITLRLESGLKQFLKLDFKSSDIVIHLGARVGPDLVSQSLEESFEINVLGTRKLALAAQKDDVAKFVYISTSHVYAFGNDFISEINSVRPINSYAQQKYLGEKEVIRIFRRHPDRVCIVRIFSLLGFDMPRESLGGACIRILHREPNFKIKNSDDIRDFLTPLQVASAIVEIAKNPLANGVINLCSGRGIRVSDAVASLISLHPNFDVGMLDNIVAGNSQNPRIVGDNTKFKGLFPELDLNWDYSRTNN